MVYIKQIILCQADVVLLLRSSKDNMRGKMSKNSFNYYGNELTISKEEWNFLVVVTIRDDYIDELKSVTWWLNGKYPYNSKLGYLHSYIMKKRYGDELYKKMREKEFVIDHIDNDSKNCRIENLSFLSNARNKAKGLTINQDNNNKNFIAMTMFKDFFIQLYQITIVFNYPATLRVEKSNNFDVLARIELAYLLYEDDYLIVLNDADSILRDYYEKYIFYPEKLRFIDYVIEGRVIENMVTPEEYNLRLERTRCPHLVKKSLLRGWKREDRKETFIIDDKDKCYNIKIN